MYIIIHFILSVLQIVQLIMFTFPLSLYLCELGALSGLNSSIDYIYFSPLVQSLQTKLSVV